MRQSAENVSLVRVAEAQFPADFADLRADRADFFMLSVLPKFTILRNLRINLRNLREIELRAYHPDIPLRQTPLIIHIPKFPYHV